jgi:dienelactone hydrolase
VGVVGMCLTGGVALGMMVDPVVVAPVLSQPSTPFPLSKAHRRSLGLSPEDLEVVKSRAAQGTCVLGLRFTGDMAVPVERFEQLRAQLGEAFIGVEIDSSEGNPWGYSKRAHSVLTEDYSDEEGSPTREALEQVLGFFADRLGVNRGSN